MKHPKKTNGIYKLTSSRPDFKNPESYMQKDYRSHQTVKKHLQFL